MATVDERGIVTPWRRGWSLDWWVRAADRWHVPAEEPGTAVTQRLVDGAPVVETAMRVPTGRVVHRAWGAVVHGTHVVAVEVENRSRQPVAVAFAVGRARRIALRDDLVLVDRRPALQLPRPPSRIAESKEAALADGGDERWGGDLTSRTREAGAAFVFPLAHTATVRVAMPLVRSRRFQPVDLAAVPDAERVARGWRAHVERPGALRVELPDPQLAERFLASRAALLLGPDSAAAETVERVVHQLVHAADGGLALASPWPDEWLGQPLEVFDAPTPHGRLSYAVRWHGARPALLWELDGDDGAPPVRLRAPALDPSWSTTERRGEALLAAVEPPGGLPGVLAPLQGGTPATEAPEEGSFG